MNFSCLLFFNNCLFFFQGEKIFNYTYDSPQNAYAKLESINYRNGKSLLLKYDYAMRINTIIQMPNENQLNVMHLIRFVFFFLFRCLFVFVFSLLF